MDKRIKYCNIEEGCFRNTIHVKYDDGTTDKIGAYYPDEIHYSEYEFIGLTKKQATDLMTSRDKAYLQR